MKEYAITLTSKGQFTMPAEVRRAFGINDQQGSKLLFRFNAKTKRAVIEQPMTIQALQQMAASFAAPKVAPLQDPRTFYQTRKARR